MMILRKITRPNAPPLTVDNRSRLRRRIALVRRVILRLGVGAVRLLILHLLLELVSWWSSVCKVCWGGDTWWTDIVGTAILSRDGSQMRDWFIMDFRSSCWADLVVGGLVSLTLMLLGIEGWRSLVVKSRLSSMTVLANVRVGCTGIEDHALCCQLDLCLGLECTYSWRRWSKLILSLTRRHQSRLLVVDGLALELNARHGNIGQRRMSQAWDRASSRVLRHWSKSRAVHGCCPIERAGGPGGRSITIESGSTWQVDKASSLGYSHRLGVLFRNSSFHIEGITSGSFSLSGR